MDISENLSHLKTDGWCLIEDLIPDGYVLRVRESLLNRERIEREEWSKIQEQWKSSGHTVPGPEVGRVQDVYSQTPEITQFLTDGRVIAIGESFFGPNMRVSSVGGIITNPGSRRGGWHADWPFNQTMAAHIAAPYQDAVLQLSGIVMVTEFVAENGATLIVPGTHRLPSNPTANIGEIRTRLHVHLFAPIVYGLTPATNKEAVRRLFEGLVRDEVRHISYTALLMEQWAQGGAATLIRQLYAGRLHTFNKITYTQTQAAVDAYGQGLFPDLVEI
jgi:hypothetical protein